MHYRPSSSDSLNSLNSWGEHDPPVPIPTTPHLRTVSLPVPIPDTPHLHTVSPPVLIPNTPHMHTVSPLVTIPNTPHLRTVSLPMSITNTPHLHTESLPGPIANAPHLRTVSLPVPIPNTPHLHTVSLPHSATPHQSPMQYQQSSPLRPSLAILNPLLTRGHNIMFNVTRDLTYLRLRPDCPPTTLQLQELAVYPPITHMTIAIFEFPSWSTKVINPHAITVNDVLFKIRQLLDQSVESYEMRWPSHAVALDYFRARSRTDPYEHAQGVKRVDFLGSKVFFTGLTITRDGSDSWDIHFSQRA